MLWLIDVNVASGRGSGWRTASCDMIDRQHMSLCTCGSRVVQSIYLWALSAGKCNVHAIERRDCSCSCVRK